MRRITCGRARSSAASAGRLSVQQRPRQHPHLPRALPRRPSAASSPSSSPTSSASPLLSESRDAEEVRELLSRYFDTCRRLIELYGGTVEKFIGDAVMAVWGTPTATEDDAERAVRAALDLVAAVSALGRRGRRAASFAPARVSSPARPPSRSAPRARAWSPATSSTPPRACSRSRSPGRVFVGESTRRATEQTIVYEDAGSFELKGKEGLTPLWTGAAGRLRRRAAR